MIKPLPNPEPYPLTPEARQEIFLSEFQNGLAQDIEDFMLSYRGATLTRDFCGKLIKKLKKLLEIYFQRHEDNKVKFNVHQAGDVIIVDFSLGNFWSIIHQIKINS